MTVLRAVALRWRTMSRSGHSVATSVAVGVALVVGVTAFPVASATASSATLFVSSAGQSAAADTSCTTAAYGQIMEAVSAASSGSTVIVCPGTYQGEVTVPSALTLLGVNATIQADGANNGIVIPTSGVTVEGFTVEGAVGEGILVVGKPGQPVTNVTVTGNVVKGNDLGNPTGATITTSPYRECNASGPVPGDCGEGIHLMVVADSTVSNNLVEGNSGGILITDEFGPSDHNKVVDNVVRDNELDCGITLPSHSTTAFVDGRVVPSAGGVFDNLVAGNTLVGNGVLGQGAGVSLAAAAPGGAVYDNVVRGNIIEGSGMSGVTVRQHAANQYLDGNVIVNNVIGVNNLVGDPDVQPVDQSTTGILVGTVAPLKIKILRNQIVGDSYGIWTSALVRVIGEATNEFQAVGVAHQGAHL